MLYPKTGKKLLLDCAFLTKTHAELYAQASGMNESKYIARPIALIKDTKLADAEIERIRKEYARLNNAEHCRLSYLEVRKSWLAHEAELKLRRKRMKEWGTR
jgi:hypothetical protein